MISYLVAGRAAGRRWLDRRRNQFYRLLQQDRLALHGLTLPHHLAVSELGVWFDELESEFQSKPRVFKMRYLARLIRPNSPCIVIFGSSHIADAIVLLALLERRGVKADVGVAPGDPDGHGLSATQTHIVSFLREATPGHSVTPIPNDLLVDRLNEIAANPAESCSLVLFTDRPIEYGKLTATGKPSLVFIHHRVNQSGLPRLRTFLRDIAESRYFIDARISNERQLLVRERGNRRFY